MRPPSPLLKSLDYASGTRSAEMSKIQSLPFRKIACTSQKEIKQNSVQDKGPHLTKVTPENKASVEIKTKQIKTKAICSELAVGHDHLHFDRDSKVGREVRERYGGIGKGAGVS